MEEQLLNKSTPNSSNKQSIALAIEEYKEILKFEKVFFSDKEATEQAISLLNLFGALTEGRKEREDEA